MKSVDVPMPTNPFQIKRLNMTQQEKLQFIENLNSMPQFEMTDLSTFLENYKDVASKELLKSIWNFANEQYSKGYDKGYHGFDDNDD